MFIAKCFLTTPLAVVAFFATRWALLVPAVGPGGDQPATIGTAVEATATAPAIEGNAGVEGRAGEMAAALTTLARVSPEVGFSGGGAPVAVPPELSPLQALMLSDAREERSRAQNVDAVVKRYLIDALRECWRAHATVPASAMKVVFDARIQSRASELSVTAASFRRVLVGPPVEGPVAACLDRAFASERRIAASAHAGFLPAFEGPETFEARLNGIACR